ncbi:MAG: thioredoxin family protein [Pseudomonadota bacterium]
MLIFEEDWCHWCEQWNDEVGVVYSKTAEGKLAPLRRIDIHGALPEGLALVSPPQYTPTFILVDDGREVGRIEGYPGEDFFWGFLARLLEKLPDPEATATGQARPATN